MPARVALLGDSAFHRRMSVSYFQLFPYEDVALSLLYWVIEEIPS